MCEATDLFCPLYQNVLNIAGIFLSEIQNDILINIKNTFTNEYM
jgi:hypothetical protein